MMVKQYQRQMTKTEILRFFQILQQNDPSPTTELQFHSPFQLLVAVLLSAQSTDKGVNKATAPLFKVATTPEDFINLGIDGIKNAIKTIGLYNTKAQNLYKTCQILVAKYHSQIPDDRAALEALPGVGRKTANVVLNTAFGHPTMAVDTHIFRLSNRTGLAPGKNVRAVEDKLVQCIPTNFMHHAHHWLILHGRYTCVARTPRCGSCAVFNECQFLEKHIP